MEIILLLAGLIIPIGVFSLIIYIIIRKLRGNSTHTAGTSFIGEIVFTNLGHNHQKEATEEIIFNREEKRDDAESGDPPFTG